MPAPDRDSKASPERHPQPIITAALVLWPQAAGASLNKADIATAPRIVHSPDPASERGFAPGTLILGSAPSIYQVGSDGIPAAQGSAADVAVVQADVDAVFAQLGYQQFGYDATGALVTDVTALRSTLALLVTDYTAALARVNGGVCVNPVVANGSTAGRLKTTANADYRIAGSLYSKSATDDLWNLSAQSATDGTHYRAFWLYVDTGGTATIVAGTDALSSAANAIAALPAIDATKSVFGVYVAGPSTTFTNALAAQGTIYNGWPGSYVQTSSAPSAITASATLTIGNGGTAGRLRLRGDVTYAIAGRQYRKASTDNLWDLSAETDTTGAQYRAYWLYLDSSGTATIAAGTNAASSAAAIAALPARVTTKAVIGVYVAGLSTDFDNAGGLAAQGTIVDGWPSAAI